MPVVASEASIVWSAIQSAVQRVAPTKPKTTSSSGVPNASAGRRSASSLPAAAGAKTSKATVQQQQQQQKKQQDQNNNNKKKKSSKEDDGLDLLQAGKDEDELIANIVAPLVNSGAISPDAGVFIEECVRGVVKFLPFLDITLDTYAEIKHRNRAHFSALRLFVYLALFRLDELGNKLVQGICKEQVPDTKALELLETMTDDATREQFYCPQWKTLYDDVFVDKVIVERKIQRQPHWGPLLAHYRKVATLENLHHGGLSPKSPKSSTKQQQHQQDEDEFGQFQDDVEEEIDDRAAQMRAYERRMQQQEEEQHQDQDSFSPARQGQKRALDISKRRFSQQLNKQSDGAVSSEIRQLEAVREPLNYPGRQKELEHRGARPPPEAERVVAEAARGRRHGSTLRDDAKEQNRQKEQADRAKVRDFVATERPMQMPRLLAEAAAREQRERETVRCPPVDAVRARLANTKQTAVVKTTQAALLREAALYKKQQEEERRRLEQAERELRSADEFEQWRTGQHADAEREKLTNVLKRKLEAQLIDEQALEAKKKRFERNTAYTRERRDEERQLLDQLKRDQEAEAERNREQAMELRSELELKRHEALEALAQEKTKSAAEVRADAERGQKEVAVRLELERQRRAELTEELRKAHSELCARKRAANQAAKELELKELRALTIDQVQEMLTTVKAESVEWLAAQRDKIKAAKEAEERQRVQLAEEVKRSRSRIVQVKTQVRSAKQEQRAQDEERRRAAEDERVLELQERLKQKREARMKERSDVRAADKQRKVAALLLEADEAHVEQKRWQELERAMERRAVESQRSGIKDSIKQSRLHDREDSLRQRNIDAKLVEEHDGRVKKDAEWERKLQRRVMADQETLDLVTRTVHSESQLQRQRRAEAALKTTSRDFSKIM